MGHCIHNEVIKLFIVLTVPDTNVSGKCNIVLDLISNGIGAMVPITSAT
jgi:hypothetical protein